MTANRRTLAVVVLALIASGLYGLGYVTGSYNATHPSILTGDGYVGADEASFQVGDTTYGPSGARSLVRSSSGRCQACRASPARDTAIEGDTVPMRHRFSSRRMAVVRLASIASIAILVSGCDLLQRALGERVVATPVQAEPAPTGTGLNGWAAFTLTDPSLAIEVPTSWRALSGSALEDQLKAQIPSLPADLAKAWTYQIQLIEQGQARYFFQGPSTDTNAIDSIEIHILTNDDSLAAAVVREDRVDSGLVGAPATRIESPVTLPIGPSAMETTTSRPSSFGVPSMNVVYFVRLDGRTIELFGSATADDVAFPALMAHVAESLRRP